MKPIKHLAIILDGNRTWARENNKIEILGHSQGAKNLEPIIKHVIKNQIAYLSLFVLSTENLKNRSPKELEHLFTLFTKLLDYSDLFSKYSIQLKIAGNLTGLPEKVQQAMQKLINKTTDNTGLVLTLCMNYGGRDEIIRAIQKVQDPKTITEQSFNQLLDTADLPDIDLVIRTSGHQRISNFLLWKLAYAEMYFPKVHWPAFSCQDLDTALEWYTQTKRKFGK